MTRRTSAASPTCSVADLSVPRAATAARFRFSLGTGETVILAGVAFYLLVLTVLPLGRLLIEGLGSNAQGEFLGILRSQWQSPSTLRALGNTLLASALATLVSVLIGGLLALAVTLTDVRGKTAITFVLLLPLLIPPQITTLAWIELLGPQSFFLRPFGLATPPGVTNPLYSMWGIVLVMGIEHATLVFLALQAGLRAIPRDLVEAARVSGLRPAKILRKIVLPLAVPALGAGAALAFVSAIGNFGVPALLGIPGRFPMLTTLIFQRLNGFGPRVLGEVAAIALILVLLTVVALWLRAFFSRRARIEIVQASGPLLPFALGRHRFWAEAALWGALAVLSLLPLGALVAAALTPALGVDLSLSTVTLRNYVAVFAQPAGVRAFVNSFCLAAATAVVSVVVAVPLAYLSAVRKNPLGRSLELIADTPYAIPGTVLAIGVIMIFLPPLPLIGISLYGTAGIILVAYLARFLMLALRPVVATLETLDPALEEAGRMVSARMLRRLVSIVLPIAAPAAAAGALLIFMTAFSELTVSALLWSTGSETLGVMIFSLQQEGNSPAADALATLTVGVTLIVALIADRLDRRLGRSIVPWRQM